MTSPPHHPAPLTGSEEPPQGRRREWLHEVIFEADTPAGKAFDVGLLIAIILSVITVMLDSVASIRAEHGKALYRAEWVFTILFTIEYVLRVATVRRPTAYMRSFFGIVDILSILPTYISVLIPGLQGLLVIRALRLLRVFRVLKLAHFLVEARMLAISLRGSARKIIIFLGVVLTLTIIMGTIMYLVEGADSGFTSIPISIYWAIVTMTTVGYGDIAPQSVLGQFIAGAVMILGYAIIAVPTGIVSAEMVAGARKNDPVSTKACQSCGAEGHAYDAQYCKFCSAKL